VSETNLSQSWRRVPIVDLCEAHVDCVNRTAPVVSEPTPFKMIRTTNVRDGFVDAENVRYVTAETYKKWTRRLVPRRNDVILTREAPLGGVGKLRSDDAIFLGQRLYHFRADPQKLEPDFLLYSLMGEDLQAQVRSFGSGSTVEHMRLEDVPNLEIDLPTLPIQRRIAGILTAYDELFENNRRRIRILEEMARKLYREWFVNFRFPGHESVPRVASALGEIPEGWEVKKVSDTFEIVGGGTPARANPEFWEQGDVQWYSPNNLTGAATMFMDDSRDHITSIGLQKSSARLFPPLSVMLTSRATIGAIAINTHEACTNQGFITCIPNHRVPLYFLFHWLTENVPTFLRMASGATFKEISRGVFKTIDFAQPPSALVHSFESRVTPIGTQMLALQRQVQNLRRTRDLLLPRLLSGNVSLPNNNS
jgi:type I restriction enzyme S subunit